MKSVAAISVLLGAASALPELSITKRDSNLRTGPVARGLVKRQGTLTTNVFDVLAWSSGGAYYANVTVGSPPQDQVVILDTGSSDLYFDASSARSCTSTGPYSCRGGTFDPSSSKTYTEVDPAPAFNTSFGDGSTAVGPFGSDVVGIGNVLVNGVQFGVAQEVSSTTGYAIGLMGIGYSINEATAHQYANMPEVLADAGVIHSRLYSVFLNDGPDISGSILFGGIDTSKYTGELVTVDILPDPSAGFVYQFVTSVTGLSASIGGKTSTVFSGGPAGVSAYSPRSGSLPVLLDTGSAAWTIPENIYDSSIRKLFNFVDRNGLCSCSHQNDADSLSIEFAGKITINVPAREFIVPVYNSSTNQPYAYGDGTDACAFMIVPGDQAGSGGFLTMGDAVLKSMYVVFDLDNGQMSLAQAASPADASPNVVTVSAGPSGIAKALSSSYSAAPPNSYSIAAPVSGTATYTFSTAATTIGVATGTAAVPNDAQVTGPSGSTSGTHATSSGAAAGLVIPSMDWSQVYVSGIAVFMAALGAAMML